MLTCRVELGREHVPMSLSPEAGRVRFGEDGDLCLHGCGPLTSGCVLPSVWKSPGLGVLCSQVRLPASMAPPAGVLMTAHTPKP